MNIFQKIVKSKDVKSAAPTQILYLNESGDPVRSPSDFKAFSEEGYRKNVVVYRCINLLSESLASIPLILRRKKADGSVEDIKQHPILDLMRKPNPAYSGTELQISAWSFFLMTGNSYLVAIGPSEKRPPQELWALRPQFITVVPGDGGLPKGYKYKPTNKEYFYPVDALGRSAIFHQKKFNPSTEWLGLSPLESAAISVDTLNTAGLWNHRLLQNSAKPSLVITVSTPLTPEQYKKLKDDINLNYEGPWKAGKPMLMGSGVDVKPVSWSPLEMDYLNSKKVSMNDIAMVFGVPGQMVGVEGSQTYANWEQARLAMYEDTVLPMKKKSAEATGNWLFPAYGADGASLEFVVDEECVDALEPRRAERWARAEKSNWLTINEKRELTGYDTFEKQSEEPADDIYIPSGLAPLSEEPQEVEPPKPSEDVEDITGLSDEPGHEPEEVENDQSDEGDDTEKSKSNYETKAQRHRRIWQQNERRLRKLESQLESSIKKHFKGESKRISTRLDSVTNLNSSAYIIDQELGASKKDLDNILTEHFMKIASTFGSDVINQMKEQRPQIETKAPIDKFSFSIRKFVERLVSKRSDFITATTRKRLLKRLRETELDRDQDGHVVKVNFGKVVSDTYNQWLTARAQTISRTDSHTMAQESTLRAVHSLDMPDVVKTWVTTNDHRLRDSHRDIKKKTIDQKDKFLVSSNNGVDMMDYPGDPDGSPENVINCRCQLVFEAGGIS
jgi:HK97 family phage portal protein